jgi:hypothetical protein
MSKRCTIHESRVMHTKTGMIFEIEIDGRLRLIDRGQGSPDDLAWITETAEAEVRAEKERQLHGSFTPRM